MKSLSLFIGSGRCNANCKHCAGVPLRKYAPKDGQIDEELILKTSQNCYDKGARYLSLSGSGEPTLYPNSITKTLCLLRKNGLVFNPINLYSNGILFGEADYSNTYLPLWRDNGLTTIYITVHNVDNVKNAVIYGIKKYPTFSGIIDNIKRYDLQIRANMIIGKNIVNNVEQLKENVDKLLKLGVDKISAWPMRKLDDTLDYENLPEDLLKMKRWADKNGVRLLLEDSKIAYHTKDKLTLFPNGVLSNTWCN